MSKLNILIGANLSKTYGELAVVKDVSLSVKDGEFVSLVGKSGCGKTTLLSLLSGLERPTKGQVMLNGKEITDASEDELALFAVLLSVVIGGLTGALLGRHISKIKPSEVLRHE